MVPDPTFFLIRHLGNLFPERQKQVTAEEFRNRLGKTCPALDGGEIYQAVRLMCKKDWPDDVFSEAVSFALERLSRQKILKYWCPDDQRKFLRTVSDEHIAYIAQVGGKQS